MLQGQTESLLEYQLRQLVEMAVFNGRGVSMMERLQTWVVEMPEVSYQCITVSDCVSDCVSFSLVLSCCLSLSLCLFHSLSSCLSVTGWLKYQRCLSYSLFLHYACCYDEIKGTQDFKICCSQLILSLFLFHYFSRCSVRCVLTLCTLDSPRFQRA